jgi:hypothetical protein
VPFTQIARYHFTCPPSEGHNRRCVAELVCKSEITGKQTDHATEFPREGFATL